MVECAVRKIEGTPLFYKPARRLRVTKFFLMRYTLLCIIPALTTGFTISCKKEPPVPISKPTHVPIPLHASPLVPEPDTSVKRPFLKRVDSVITKNGIGMVRLGMTLTELKKKFPLAKFESRESGDGVTWMEFTTEAGDTMSLHVDPGESDSSASDLWNHEIDYIEIFSPVYATESGVRVGDLISVAEMKIGKIKSISESDIEARQYVEFEGQPMGLVFMIDYSGVFTDGTRITRKYEDSGKILSISTTFYP